MSSEKHYSKDVPEERPLSAAQVPTDEADVDEYELEPPDPDVLASEQRHAQQAIDHAASRIDIDELFREQEQVDHDELFRDFIREGKFGFQIKHLLWATAVLAIFMAIGTLTNSFPLAFLLLFLVGGGVGLNLLYRREKEHTRKLEEKKQAFRDKLQSKGPDEEATAPSPNELDEVWEKAREEQSFKFAFSVQQLLIAMTVASIVMGLTLFLGGADKAALILGVVALFGLVVNAVGYDPPHVVVLGWWLVLALYVLMSVVDVMWGNLAGP